MMQKISRIRSWIALCALVGGIAALAGPASAQINSPVPSDAYIVYAGLDWAWGGPCPYSGGCFSGSETLAYQGTQGWTLPSAADMAIVDSVDASNPAAFANLFYGSSGNVPVGGTDPVSGAFFNDSSGGACASPYFGTLQNCDASDGDQGAWNGSVLGANYADQGIFYDEQLFVRPNSVPEPTTWALMLTGFGMVGYAMRRKLRFAYA